MKIHISHKAAARLQTLLSHENSAQLAVRVVPLTSGCSTPSFALELTKIRQGFITQESKGVCFACPRQEAEWMDGMVIDWDQESDKFSVYHPNPPFLNDCQRTDDQ
ncbi:iron-sulfur cluster biosynthesis family protein [Melghirimyces algeriensis]|uniref:Fe-S cluster assembly iron-binding protein IscA n=1 Tax=Melghirimyces algeriensis TaxID=910412 RepID=A0A521DPI9_9BACL|nr:iron-sulfur cluster biosynthesis family protein [Melghirimyces algeriensis]SMO73011.1 Fe-S cluster assembly iron-binding protein IscA [Melghirimyces algeriensis]